MKKIILSILIIVSLAFASEAKYRQVCNAQYMTEDGWSKTYQVEITFMTGFELNQATNSSRYSSFSVYATIFWGRGQASVIKLSNYMLCGLEVDKSCIVNSIGNLKGFDQDGDEWKICKDQFCF